MTAHKIKHAGLSLALVMTFFAAALVTKLITAPQSAYADSDTETTIDSCSSHSEPEVVIAALQTREEELNQRESEISNREKNLLSYKAEVEEKLQELRSMETQLRETNMLIERDTEAKIAGLISVYNEMDPERAADILQEMDAPLAAGFVARMEPKPAAEIFGLLEPNTAYAITTILAGKAAQ